MQYSFELEFPTGNTTADAYNDSNLRRAIKAYKLFLPTIATEEVIQQMLSVGAKANEVGIVMATSPKQQFVTNL